MRTEQKTDDNGITYVLVDGKETLSYTESFANGLKQVTLCARGEITQDTVFSFTDEIEAFVSVGADIILNLEGISYMNSKAQIQLQIIQQQIESNNKGSLKLILPKALSDEFDNNGISDYFDITVVSGGAKA